MKLAVLICGETRTWTSTDVEQNSWVPRKYPTVSDGWKNFKDRSLESLGIDVDFYGITWSYCQTPRNTEFFKEIKYLDFHGSEYRSEKLMQCQEKISELNRVGGHNEEYFWNTIAQYYQWIEGFKLVFDNSEYDFVLKSRWDIVPEKDASDIIISKLNNIGFVDYQNQSFIGVQEMSVTEHSRDNKKIKFLDINFIINKHLYFNRFDKQKTSEILHDHIMSNSPEGIGNYSLFCPHDQEPNNRHIESMMGSNLFYRVEQLGFSDYYYQDDYKKNLSNNRPPT